MVLEYESQHLPHQSPRFVGKYIIHGAFGYCTWLIVFFPHFDALSVKPLYPWIEPHMDIQ